MGDDEKPTLIGLIPLVESLTGLLQSLLRHFGIVRNEFLCFSFCASIALLLFATTMHTDTPVLKAIQAGDRAPSAHFQAETLEKIEALPQPVIAAVQGHCYTGSLELALACDLLVAAEGAKFADTHGKWGMSPTWGMSQRLPRRVGLVMARELMFSGRVVDGAEAVRIGLANCCVADTEFLATATAMARQFLENSWHTLRMDKLLINGGLDHTLQAGLAFERATSPGAGPDTAERLGGFAKNH